MANIRRIFFGGNTADGFYSFHDNIIGPNGNRFFILKGMPGGGKSSLMKKIGEFFKERGYTIEFHHCPSDPESVDSILITELRIAIADGTAPHIMDPVYPGLKGKIIDLAQFIDGNKLKESEDKIIKAKQGNKEAYNRAFSYLRAAKNIYELIVENNSKGVDFQKLNKKTLRLMNEIFSKKPEKDKAVLFKERHGFSTANSPVGFVDYTDSLLEGIDNIYFINGEIGTGKSTLLKRITEECRIRDYSIEIYHNSTFPDKIETLIIKDLNTCITSNSKGTRFPHIFIDLNEYFNYEVKNKGDYEMYNHLYRKAIECLSEARKNHDILEKAYIPTIDYKKIDEVREKIIEEILEFANS
jgi:ABC-type proline/glycine betaine transport system ATPase subunit